MFLEMEEATACLENAGGERATFPAIFIPFNLQVPWAPLGM